MNQGRPGTSAAGSLRFLVLCATSPGQRCWISKRAKSTSSPSHPISWRPPARTSVGAISHKDFHKDFSMEPSPDASLKPSGASGSFRIAGNWPIRRDWPTSSAPMPSAARRGAPNRLASTGIVCALGLSKINAGPPAPRVRSQIFIISSRVKPAPKYAVVPPIVANWKENCVNRDTSCFFTFFYDRI